MLGCGHDLPVPERHPHSYDETANRHGLCQIYRPQVAMGRLQLDEQGPAQDMAIEAVELATALYEQ